MQMEDAWSRQALTEEVQICAALTMLCLASRLILMKCLSDIAMIPEIDTFAQDTSGREYRKVKALA